MGVVILGAAPETAEQYRRKQLTNLIRVGSRVAVLGVEDGLRAHGWWHVMVPGSFGAPQGLSGTRCQGDDLVYGKSLCGKTNVVSNGYIPDWRPPKGKLCPACSERI